MIKKAVFYLIFCLLGLFLQGSLIHATFPSFVAPDFIVIVVVFLGLRDRNLSGLLASFCLGLLGDFASGVYLGPFAGGCVLVFSVSAVIAQRVYAERTLAIVIICFCCSVIKSLYYLSVLSIYVSADVFTASSGGMMIFEALITALVAPIVFKILFSPDIAHLKVQPARRGIKYRAAKAKI
jgi:rod shape-determining protein MreD